MAYGPLGLRPWELRRLTFVELAQLTTAWAQREEGRKAELAWVLSWLVSPHPKRPIPPADFLRSLIGDAAFVRRKHAEIDAAKAATAT